MKTLSKSLLYLVYHLVYYFFLSLAIVTILAASIPVVLYFIFAEIVDWAAARIGKPWTWKPNFFE